MMIPGSTDPQRIEVDHDFGGDMDSDEASELAALIVDGVTQKWTRFFSESVEQIVGIVRCDFADQQNCYVVNVPIHPPLAAIPQVEANPINGEARVRFTQRERFGVRLEVVLTAKPTDSRQLFLEISISASQ